MLHHCNSCPGLRAVNGRSLCWQNSRDSLGTGVVCIENGRHPYAPGRLCGQGAPVAFPPDCTASVVLLVGPNVGLAGVLSALRDLQEWAYHGALYQAPQEPLPETEEVPRGIAP